MDKICKGAAVAAFGILYFITLSACMPKHNDGAGDLWKAVKYTNETRR